MASCIAHWRGCRGCQLLLLLYRCKGCENIKKRRRLAGISRDVTEFTTDSGCLRCLQCLGRIIGKDPACGLNSELHQANPSLPTSVNPTGSPPPSSSLLSSQPHQVDRDLNFFFFFSPLLIIPSIQLLRRIAFQLRPVHHHV